MADAEDVLKLLDTDLRYGDRKPAFADQFDPRWAVAMYHGMFDGPHGMVSKPYVVRGSLPLLFDNSGSTAAAIQTVDGRAVSSASTCGLRAAFTTPTFALSTVQGTLITTFRASLASGSTTPNDAGGALMLQQYVGGVWQVACPIFDNASGKLFWGWYNNGTETRVGVSRTGLWAAGDLVTTGFSYSSLGTRAFVKGQLVASSGTAASTFNTVTTGSGMNWGVGETGDPGNANRTNLRWGSNILNAVVLDRALTDAEWGYVHENPLSWMFAPNTSIMSTTSGPPTNAVIDSVLQEVLDSGTGTLRVDSVLQEVLDSGTATLRADSVLQEVLTAQFIPQVRKSYRYRVIR